MIVQVATASYFSKESIYRCLYLSIGLSHCRSVKETQRIMIDSNSTPVNEKDYSKPLDDHNELGHAATSDPGRRRRHPSMPNVLPGAFPMRSRAIGERPDWAAEANQQPQQQQQQQLNSNAANSAEPPPAADLDEEIPYSLRPDEHHDFDLPSSSSSPENAPIIRVGQPEPFKWRPGIAISWICLLGAVGMGVGLRYGLNTGGPGDVDLPSTTEPTPTENHAKLQCQLDLQFIYENDEQPSIDQQCDCLGKIIYLRKQTELKYEELRDGFLSDLTPNYNEDRTSCSFQNRALVWLALDAANVGDANDPLLRDRYLLALLYNAWNGTSWDRSDGWLTPNPICEWEGIKCVNDIQTGDTISALELSQNNLRGNIPCEIGLFPSLRSLNVSLNGLDGNIATEIVSLKELKLLDLSQNQLEGSISASLLSTTSLQYLDLAQNHLESSLPSELGLLTSLTHLSLSANVALTGSIPTELWELSQLQVLRLSACGLTGSIPSNVGGMSDLQVLLLAANSLQGTIPTEIGTLSQLRWLNWSHNLRPGTLPSEIGNLVHLEALALASSGLIGTIPEEYTALEKLAVLDLGDNALTGTVPIGILELTDLHVLQLRSNQLTGDVPTTNTSDSLGT